MDRLHSISLPYKMYDIAWVIRKRRKFFFITRAGRPWIIASLSLRLSLSLLPLSLPRPQKPSVANLKATIRRVSTDDSSVNCHHKEWGETCVQGAPAFRPSQLRAAPRSHAHTRTRQRAGRAHDK